MRGSHILVQALSAIGAAAMLAACSGAAVTPDSQPRAAKGAVDRDATVEFAYVANMGSKNVSAYAINASSGALNAVSGSPFATGNNPSGVA
ncbi:MAG: YncE family protein, partial [Candidatus Cybelea sp.]